MPSRPPAARVTRLTLANFRSFETLRLETGPGPVVLTGPNGSGKTNLLEALSLLAPGRGLRGAAIADLSRWSTDGPVPPWAVAAQVRIGEGPSRDIGTGLDPETAIKSPAREKRVIRIDGRSVTGQSALAELFPLVWLTPDMDPLLRGPALERRRFLDRLVTALDPDHTGRVAAYARAQRDRLRLLQEGRSHPAWLTGLEDVMARYGIAMAAARRDLVDRLSAALEDGPPSFPSPRLDLESRTDRWLADGPALLAEDQLRAALAQSREDDARSGTSGVGPHKDDLLVFHARSDAPARQTSTGEQKAMLIALLIAHARVLSHSRRLVPLMLLDDVASHLDEKRRDALYEAIDHLGAQVWVSGTDAQAFENWGRSAQFFSFQNASVVQ